MPAGFGGILVEVRVGGGSLTLLVSTAGVHHGEKTDRTTES